MELNRWQPPPTDPAPDGYVWALLADPDWELTPDSGRPCRMTQGRPPKGCGSEAVAALWRKTKGAAGGRRQWFYCADHLYGRTVWGLRVVSWVLREVAPTELVCAGRDHDDMGKSRGRRCGRSLVRISVLERDSFGFQVFGRFETLEEMTARARSGRGWSVPDSDYRLAMCPTCLGPRV